MGALVLSGYWNRAIFPVIGVHQTEISDINFVVAFQQCSQIKSQTSSAKDHGLFYIY